MTQRFFAIEFLEDAFSVWFLHELMQMQSYLRARPRARLVVSNFTAACAASDEESREGLRLWREFCAGESHPPAELPLRLADYVDAVSGELRVLDESIPLAQVCLLDLKAAEPLRATDGTHFRLFLFGGILGDNPPRGRTDVLLPHFPHRRHLLQRQLATDTAVLVTSIVVNDGRELTEVPFLDEPELASAEDPGSTVAMTGFSYVSDRYDPVTGHVAPPGGPEAPLMSPAVRELLFLDFDAALLG